VVSLIKVESTIESVVSFKATVSFLQEFNGAVRIKIKAKKK
jgi:hypothetical protein